MDVGASRERAAMERWLGDGRMDDLSTRKKSRALEVLRQWALGAAPAVFLELPKFPGAPVSPR